MDLLRLEAGLVGVDEEAGDAAVALVGVGLGEHQRDLGVVAERDEHLRAVDHPARVGLLGARLLVGGVRAGVGLGQPEAPEPLARAQLRQVVLLLLLGPPAQDAPSTRARSGPRSRSASPSRRGRSPRRSARRSGSRARRRRTRAGRSRRGSPASAIFWTSSRSKCSLRSFSRARSTISLSVKARAVSRTRRCSSLSSKSMAGTLPQRSTLTARCRPRPRYARSGELHIAYQVVGDGPIDLLWVPSWISQVEHYWEEPWSPSSYFKRLASFSRLIMFDRRGLGLSDPLPRRRAARSRSRWTTSWR